MLHCYSAADLFITNVFHKEYCNTRNKHLKPCRIYFKGRNVRTIDPDNVLPYCLLAQDGRPRDPTQNDIATNRLFVTTLANAFSLLTLDPQPTFTHILIDEGGQAIETESLISIAMANEQTKIVIAGDHLQVYNL